ncbi:hypothetical protein AAE250_12765 [Bacteroides sp. GD17]|jgi:hypothetical protein|uniref:hypothetical protein n=1 Tax=Bacteroides sp. GD17 TaxID=3139826 RepID=UPI0025F5CF39|nr:hypothetical protein [uncultured Bacteroides sp.]
MKRLIIADVKSNNNKGHCTGHYFALAQNYLDLYQDVCLVLVGGGPVYKINFEEEDLLALPYDSVNSKSAIRNKWRVLMNCHYLFGITTPKDVIVLQMSGAVTTFVGIALFAKKWNNIHCIQYSEESLSSPIKRWIYNLAKKKIKGIICPNSRIGQAYDRPYCEVTDYIYPHYDRLMVSTSYFEKKYDFAIVGSIWPDKGVLEAAEWLGNTGHRLLIAGNTHDTAYAHALRQIAKEHENIELHIEFVSDDDYHRYIRQSRYCILNYQGVYSNRSSGVVLDTLFNYTPVVGRRCNALRFIEDEQVGYLYDDIRHLSPDLVLNETIYRQYTAHIETYLHKQKEYKERVIHFLNLKSQDL